MDRIMVSAATGVMNSLLTKLTTLLCEEYKLQKGVKRDITFLKDELSSMNALLEKLAEMEVLDPQQKEWRNQVREMAYDIEDCIDEYMHRFHQDPGESSSIKGLFRKTIKKVKKLGACHEINEQIKELKTRIVEASERRDRYRLDAVLESGNTGVVPIDPRLPALYAEASDLVGIDGPRDELIKLVDDGERRLKVVSIVGFGGLGKTTLANQVSRNIGVQFDCQAFVSVSQKPDMRKILRTIFLQLGVPQKKKKQVGDNFESWDEERLIHELRDFLKDKRYFVVIDDIWSTPSWRTIKCALLENNCGSRIIVTTRILTVAESCCSLHHDSVYKLRSLSETNSKKLFFRRIFASEDGCPPHLKEVSVEIIRKCGGLPLAIITMASLLVTRLNSKEYWVSVQNSIGSGLEHNSDVEEMKKILYLSYSDLPPHLRTCLLYLSMFPEDYDIQRCRLIHRWVAEGFVKVKTGRTLEEEGECYFNELINRSMIQPVNIDQYNGQASACRVHDMIHDLIISIAVEENFVTFLGCQTHLPAWKDKVRRLISDYRGQEYGSGTVSPTTCAHVRSLGSFGYFEKLPPLSDFRAVRVVDIVISEEMQISSLNIGNLFQLRYLRIEALGYSASILEQIGELKFLETLDLYHTEITELPASILQLRQLKYLLVCGAKMPDGIGRMQALEELSIIAVDDSTSIIFLQELGSLAKLRILKIDCCMSDSHKGNIAAHNLVLSVSKLGRQNLRSLYFSGDPFPFDLMDSWYPPPYILRELSIIDVFVHKIPEWMASLDNLTSLHIAVNPVRQETLQILGDVPALLVLELNSDKADPKERLVISNSMFRCLKKLHLCCWDLGMGLIFEEGATPTLENLSFPAKVCGVQSARGAPDLGISHLHALKWLKVWIDCSGARPWEVEALEAAIRNAADLLPNRPTPDFLRAFEKDMKQKQEYITASSCKALPGSTCHLPSN